MILWFKQKQDEYISIDYLDLRDPTQMWRNTLKFLNTGGQPYGINNFSLTLRNIWEITNNRFMLIAETSSKGFNHQYKAEVVNNNYIYDSVED